MSRRALKPRWHTEGHKAQWTSDKTSRRQCVSTHKDEGNLPAVDGLEIMVHQSNTDGCARQTLGGRGRQTKTGSHQHSGDRTNFNSKSTRRAHLSDPVIEGADNVIPHKPEAEAQQETSDNQEPDWGGRPRVDGGNRSNSVSDIIEAVGNRHEHCGQDLAPSAEVLDANIVPSLSGVDVADEIRLLADGVNGDTSSENEFGPVPQLSGVEPR